MSAARSTATQAVRSRARRPCVRPSTAIPVRQNILPPSTSGGFVSNQPYLDRIPPGYFLIREFLHDIAPHVDFDSVRTIFDIGSRDLQQSIEFATVFPNAHT